MVEGEVCLFRAGNRCLKCAENCPVGALNDWGIDRKLCFDRLRFNRENLIELSDLPENTHVCGKCVVNVPCSFKNPVIQ
jgi:ferredoxin